jgi:DNA-directed RNA polymerase specialized sigma subunit
LTLSANKISDEVHGSGISKPVERIYEEKERITKLYENRLKGVGDELEQYLKKERIYKKWFADSKLNEKETDVIKYTYSDGLTDWKIASKMIYDSRTVRRIRKKALEKLSANVLIDVIY